MCVCITILYISFVKDSSYISILTRSEHLFTYKSMEKLKSKR